MKPHRDELEWAYLDGELSPAESATLDEPRSQEECDRLAVRMAFKNAIEQNLSTEVPCPETAWQHAMAQITDSAEPPAPARIPWIRRRSTWAMAAAATLLIGLSTLTAVMMMPGPKTDMPSFLSDNTFTGNTDKDSFDWVTRSFFRQFAESLRADLASFTHNAGGSFTVTGTRQTIYAGEPVLEVCVDCAGAPAKVVVARRGGMAAGEIGKALALGSLKASRPMGDFLVAVVNNDAPEQLVNLVVSPSSSLNAAKHKPSSSTLRSAKRHTQSTPIPARPSPKENESQSIAQGGAPGMDGPVTQMDALIRGVNPSTVMSRPMQHDLADVAFEEPHTPGDDLLAPPFQEDADSEFDIPQQPSRPPRAAGPI